QQSEQSGRQLRKASSVSFPEREFRLRQFAESDERPPQARHWSIGGSLRSLPQACRWPPLRSSRAVLRSTPKNPPSEDRRGCPRPLRFAMFLLVPNEQYDSET